MQLPTETEREREAERASGWILRYSVRRACEKGVGSKTTKQSPMEMENIVESPARFKTLFSFLLRTHLPALPPQTNQQSNTLTTNQLRECGNNRKGGVAAAAPAVVLQEHFGFVEMRYGRFKGCGYCGSSAASRRRAPVRGKGSVRIWHGRHSPLLVSRLVGAQLQSPAKW